MSQENVELVRRAFDAFERGGLAGMLPQFDCEVEWGDAGIGAGGLLALAAIASGAVVAIRHRPDVPTPSRKRCLASAAPLPRGPTRVRAGIEGTASAVSRRLGFFGRYTKVNRLLTEGRRAFLRRVSGIQRGAECARYEPLLSALADGEATAEDLALLRPHMRTCLSCRAALREFRVPDRVASVVPPVALAADGGGPLRSLLESVVGAAQHKTAAMGERLHAAAELATGQKLAAMAASAAALAGGGTAIDEFANHERAARAAQVAQRPTEGPAPEAPDPSPPPVVPPEPPPEATSEPQAAPAPQPAPAPPPPAPDPAEEFAPTGTAAQAAPGSTLQASSGPAPSEPAGSLSAAGGSGGDGSSGAGSGEFAP